MKAFGVLALFLLFGAAFTIFSFSGPIGGFWFPNLFFTNGSDTNTLTIAGRKLKENGANIRGNKEGDAAGYVGLDDYPSFDPSPSSKASMRPGPIDHGTPLIPFIPKPSPPPARPTFGGSP